LFDAAANFYEKDRIMAISVGSILMVLACVLIVFCLTGCFYFCRRVFGQRGSYKLPHNRTVQDNLDKYEMIPLEDFKTSQGRDSFENHSKLRTRVMLTDEYGNIPPYTLRTRSVDGTGDKYTTYYNYRVVKETEL